MLNLCYKKVGQPLLLRFGHSKNVNALAKQCDNYNQTKELRSNIFIEASTGWNP